MEPNLESNNAPDVALLAAVSDLLGGVDAASNFVCRATVLRDYPRDYDTLVSDWVDFQVGQWRLCNTQSHLDEMTEQEYTERSRAAAHDHISEEIVVAETDLAESLADIGEKEAAPATDLLAILGIARTADGFQVVDYDTSRAVSVERVAKLMSSGYREFIAINPNLLEYIDPYIAGELAGRAPENPDIRQRYDRLWHDE